MSVTMFCSLGLSVPQSLIHHTSSTHGWRHLYSSLSHALHRRLLLSGMLYLPCIFWPRSLTLSKTLLQCHVLNKAHPYHTNLKSQSSPLSKPRHSGIPFIYPTFHFCLIDMSTLYHIISFLYVLPLWTFACLSPVECKHHKDRDPDYFVHRCVLNAPK